MCPTEVGASHLPQGQTFHSVFKIWTPSLSAGTAIDEIFKSLGGNQLKNDRGRCSFHAERTIPCSIRHNTLINVQT
jgi:hypothetical protein